MAMASIGITLTDLFEETPTEIISRLTRMFETREKQGWLWVDDVNSLRKILEVPEGAPEELTHFLILWQERLETLPVRTLQARNRKS